MRGNIDKRKRKENEKEKQREKEKTKRKTHAAYRSDKQTSTSNKQQQGPPETAKTRRHRGGLVHGACSDGIM